MELAHLLVQLMRLYQLSSLVHGACWAHRFSARNGFRSTTQSLMSVEFGNRTEFIKLVDLLRDKLIQDESKGSLRKGFIEPLALFLRLILGKHYLYIMVRRKM